MKAAPKDVVHAFLRAVSPFLATCPAAHDGTRAPSNSTSKQPSRAPNLPQPVLLSGNKKTKTARKTCAGDVFLPTANAVTSKKAIENKDTRA